MKVKKSGDIIVQNGQYVEVLRTKMFYQSINFS